MPRVPVYEPTVRTSPLAAPQRSPVSPDAFGAGLAEGLGRIAGAINSMQRQAWEEGQRERAKQDRAALDLAEVGLTEAGLEAEKTLRSRQGVDAIKAGDEIATGWEDRVKTIRSTLATPEQQQAFDVIAARHDVRLRGTIADHQLREGERVADTAAEAKAQAFQQAAIEHRRFPEHAYSDLAEGASALWNRLTEKGAAPEVKDQAHKNYISRGVADIIAATADDRDHVGAARLLERYQNRLTNPADLARAQRVVEQATTMGESMRIVDDLMKTDPTVQGVMDRAKGIQDPILRKAVEDRGMDMLRLREQAHEQGQGQLMADIYKTVKTGQTPSPGQLAGLDPKNQEQLSRWMRPEKIPWQDSKAIRYQFQQALADPAQRQTMASTDMRQFLFRVNEDDFQAMVGLQEDARQGGANGLTSMQERIDTSFVELTGTAPKPFTIKDGKAETNPQYVAWNDAVATEANAIATAANRKKPSPEDVQKAIDTVLTRKVRIDEVGRDPEVVAAVVNAKDRKSAYVPIDQVGPGKAAAIRDLIRKAGGTPTDDRVQRAYAARLLNDRSLLDSILAEKD